MVLLLFSPLLTLAATDDELDVPAIEITNPVTEVADFFDFKTKLKNNDINKERAKQAEAENLKKEGLENFRNFQVNLSLNQQPLIERLQPIKTRGLPPVEFAYVNL